ncbi:VOC family protein [Rhodococcus sp. NPDC057529]|uniref:VOC family protein n=1 Tax=Rhodococcus sp. NPDC057529 TaxID=3346158 RepID=UPI0036717040
MPLTLNKFFHVNINVTDLDRSVDFYKKLGFVETARFVMDGHLGESTAEAFGVPFNRHRAAFLKLQDSESNMVLDLCEYEQPPTSGQPYQSLINVGMVRLAFHVPNIEEVYQELLDMGVEMLGPLRFTTPPGGTRSGVLAFKDPDGVILEVLTGVEHMVN